MSIRKSSARVVLDLTRSLTNNGVLLIEEWSQIREVVSSLAVAISPAPAPIEQKFLTGPEVAAKLNISFSQFKQLYSEGAIPFQKHIVGSRNARFLLSDVIHYMEVVTLETPATVPETTITEAK